MFKKQIKKNPVRTYLIAYDAAKKLKSRGITIEGATPAEAIERFERFLDSLSSNVGEVTSGKAGKAKTVAA